MPTWGGVNNTTTTGEVWMDSAVGGHFVGSAAAFPENGTLDSVHIFCRRYNSGYNIRTAIYTGGTSDDDPNGATLLADLGVSTFANLPAAAAWHTVTAGSQAISVGARLWLALKGQHGIFMGLCNGASLGNLNLDAFHSVGLGNDDTEAFAASIGATGPSNHSTTESWKWYVTYSVAGGAAAISVAPIIQNYRNMQVM